MRYIDNIDKVINEHEKWLCTFLRDENADSDGMADFSNCDIHNFDFSNRNLSHANFTGARISCCTFNNTLLNNAAFLNATIVESRFNNATLKNADFRCSTIGDCTVTNSNFTSVSFIGASICYTSFKDSCLSYTDFTGARFYYARITKTEMFGSYIEHAFFTCTEIDATGGLPFIGLKCPSEGAFIAWKVCLYNKKKVIVKLLIPEDAKRTSFTTLKCRADKAVVLEIQDAEGNKLRAKKVRSTFDSSFVYEVGKTVKPKYEFNEARHEECTSGIHFFVDRKAALTLM